MHYTINTTELRKEMIGAGYTTILSFAMASGVSRATIGKILSGEIRPSADVMDKLADTLHLTPEKAGEIFFAENLRSV